MSIPLLFFEKEIDLAIPIKSEIAIEISKIRIGKTKITARNTSSIKTKMVLLRRQIWHRIMIHYRIV